MRKWRQIGGKLHEAAGVEISEHEARPHCLEVRSTVSAIGLEVLCAFAWNVVPLSSCEGEFTACSSG